MSTIERSALRKAAEEIANNRSLLSLINYRNLSDADKLDLLRVLYHDLKTKDAAGLSTARDIEQKKLVLAETCVVYSRIKQGQH